MEKLAELPPLAIIALGVTLALIVGVRYLGLSAGISSSPEKNAGAAQVAAVIVDPTALNRAAAAVEGHTVATLKLIDELDEIREEMRISREIIRRGGV